MNQRAEIKCSSHLENAILLSMPITAFTRFLLNVSLCLMIFIQLLRWRTFFVPTLAGFSLFSIEIPLASPMYPRIIISVPRLSSQYVPPLHLTMKGDNFRIFCHSCNKSKNLPSVQILQYIFVILLVDFLNCCPNYDLTIQLLINNTKYFGKNPLSRVFFTFDDFCFELYAMILNIGYHT